MWLIVLVLALVAAGSILYLVPRLRVGWYDHRARMVAADYRETAPRMAGESEEAYLRRLHWHLLTTLGLPPVRAVELWSTSGHEHLVPSSAVVRRYLEEREGALLPTGKRDRRIGSGEGWELYFRLRQREGHAS